MFLLESEYQSKQTVNETQRDAKVALLLIDQWLVQGLKSLTGLISSNVRGSLTSSTFQRKHRQRAFLLPSNKTATENMQGFRVSLFGAVIPLECCCFLQLANRCCVQSVKVPCFFPPQLQLRAIKDLVHN